MVAERGGFLGRADDVGEENRGEHAVDCDGGTRAGQKLLYRTAISPALSPTKGRWSTPGNSRWREPGICLGEKATALDADDPVFRPIDDEGRHPDRRDDVANVNQMVHPRVRGSASGAIGYSLVLAHQRLNAELFMRQGAYIATLPPLPQ